MTMGIRRGNLDIFFHRISPDTLLNSLSNGEMFKKSPVSHTKMDRDIYYRLAVRAFPHHSEDEHAEFYNRAMQSMSGNSKKREATSVFNVLHKYANDILIGDNGVPICRFERILNWRSASLNLGQDLFTCSYFAYRDVQNRTKTDIFSWPAIINTDNGRLRQLLQKGVAENHFHLFGSSRTFELNWLALMNHDELIRDVSIRFKRPLNYDVLEPTGYHDETTWLKRLKQASIIRALLFRHLMDNTAIPNDIFFQLDDPRLIDINAEKLRFAYGYRLPNSDIVLDYALVNFLHDGNYKYNRALVGERYFLYQCLRRIYENSDAFNSICRDLLYLYLLIKSQFRGELIQLNRQVGFKNFSDYQDRKDAALTKMLYYQREQVLIAINEVTTENNMQGFETRIIPKDSIKKTHDLLYEIHRALNDKTKDTFDMKPITQDDMEAIPHFYVFHFPKKADKPPSDKSPKPNELFIKCRNHDIRKENKQRALAMAGLLNEYPKFRKIIRGIDGCSNEIGCRPEVLANDFRFLSEFIPASPSMLYGKASPLSLKRTFHVGEDFMDMPDGLRAIDEAINFLELRRGDRLGHALALGMDCKMYYRKKGNRIVLKQHDLLDNLCWLLCRSTSLGISVPPKLRESLYRRYHEIIQSIYENYPYHDIEIFHDAWHLRGDAPEQYRSGRFCEYDNFFNGYERFGVNEKFSPKYRYQKTEQLYHAYHYDPMVRHKGAETVEFLITTDLMDLIEQMQQAMQWFIEGKGIGIETNPTSNILISPIDRFDEHPILRFFNQELEIDASLLRQSAQLFVSINTDDQGVFDTSLENEFAVIVCALERVLFPNGEKKYPSANIYRWIDLIRFMGIEQNFGDSHNKKIYD